MVIYLCLQIYFLTDRHLKISQKLLTPSKTVENGCSSGSVMWSLTARPKEDFLIIVHIILNPC